MKKAVVLLIVLAVALSFASCGQKYSNDYYEEVSTFVRQSNGIIPPLKDVEYYFYDTQSGASTNDYYGYYYTKNGEKLNCAQDKMDLPSEYTENDGGYYFGKPKAKGDWSFVKEIRDNWYYFEAHDYIYN